MNSSRVSQTDTIDPIVVAYAVVGLASVITNSIIFATLASDKKLLSNSALLAGFAISHLLLGTDIATSGIVRLINRAVLNQPMSPLKCLQMIYPIAYPMAFQGSALLLCLAGLERLAAVAFPHWFRKWMSPKKTWYLVGLVFLLVAISVSVGLSFVPSLPMTTRQCGQPQVMGTAYTNFVRLSSACGGTVGVVLTLAALVVGARRIRKLPLLSGEAGKMKRQIQLTKAMLGVAFVDFCLVVIPNSISFISGLTGIVLPSFMGPLQSNVAFCVNAVSAVFPYLIFNSQFRRAAAKLFRIGAKGSVHAATVAIDTQPRIGQEKAVTWATRRS